MKRCIADIPLVTHLQKESAGMNKLYSQSMCSVKQWKSYQAAEALISAEVEEVRAEADEIEPGWSQVNYNEIFLFFTYSMRVCVCVLNKCYFLLLFFSIKLIWKQAMQYHAMLKNRQEMEAKAAAAAREAQALKKDEADTAASVVASSSSLGIGTTTTATSGKKNSSTNLSSSQPSTRSNLSDEELKRKQEEAAEKAAQELIKMEEREKESKKSMSGMKKGFLDGKGGGSSKKK